MTKDLWLMTGQAGSRSRLGLASHQSFVLRDSSSVISLELLTHSRLRRFLHPSRASATRGIRMLRIEVIGRLDPTSGSFRHATSRILRYRGVQAPTLSQLWRDQIHPFDPQHPNTLR